MSCAFVGVLLLFKVARGGGLPVRDLGPAAGGVAFANRLVVGGAAGVHVRLRFCGLCGQIVALAGDVRAPVEFPSRFALRRRSLAAEIVQGAEQFVGVPNLIARRVVAPGAAEHDELDLVDDVPHLMQRVQACHHLQIRVEPIAFGALAGRLVGKVAFRHADVVGTVQTGARAGPGLCEDGDRRNARSGAARLDLKRSHQVRLKRVVDAPSLPRFAIVLLHVLVEREQLLFRHIADGACHLAVPRTDDLVQSVRRKGLPRLPQRVDYVQKRLFHGRYCTARPPGCADAVVFARAGCTSFTISAAENRGAALSRCGLAPVGITRRVR